VGEEAACDVLISADSVGNETSLTKQVATIELKKSIQGCLWSWGSWLRHDLESTQVAQ
jgi:hypothetical protein